MNKDLSDRKTDRRSFLKGLAAAGGLTAVAGTAEAAAAGESLASPGPAGQRHGYRVTPHVAKYYDKARF